MLNTLKNATECKTGVFACSLLIACGRRPCELISSDDSTFTYYDEHAALFNSTVKHEPNDASKNPYIIPLLCNFALFDKARRISDVTV